MSAPDMPRNVTIATCVFLSALAAGYVAHAFISAPKPPAAPKACAESTWNPAQYYRVDCEPPARLVTPPGWTWLKCECPQ
jgi:hypothetical protein